MVARSTANLLNRYRNIDEAPTSQQVITRKFDALPDRLCVQLRQKASAGGNPMLSQGIARLGHLSRGMAPADGEVWRTFRPSLEQIDLCLFLLPGRMRYHVSQDWGIVFALEQLRHSKILMGRNNKHIGLLAIRLLTGWTDSSRRGMWYRTRLSLSSQSSQGFMSSMGL